MPHRVGRKSSSHTHTYVRGKAAAPGESGKAALTEAVAGDGAASADESSDDDDEAFSGVPRRSVGTLADGAWSGRAGVGHLTDGSLSDDSCESEASSDSEEAHRQSETLPAADAADSGAGASSCLPSAARAAAIADLASQVGTPRPPAALPTAAPQHVNKATQLAPCRLRGQSKISLLPKPGRASTGTPLPTG